MCILCTCSSVQSWQSGNISWVITSWGISVKERFIHWLAYIKIVSLSIIARFYWLFFGKYFFFGKKQFLPLKTFIVQFSVLFLTFFFELWILQPQKIVMSITDALAKGSFSRSLNLWHVWLSKRLLFWTVSEWGYPSYMVLKLLHIALY